MLSPGWRLKARIAEAQADVAVRISVSGVVGIDPVVGRKGRYRHQLSTGINGAVAGARPKPSSAHFKWLGRLALFKGMSAQLSQSATYGAVMNVLVNAVSSI